MVAAGAPVRSPELQFLISAGAAGLGGRGRWSEREHLNEKAGCGCGAPLCPARLGGSAGRCGEGPFLGALLLLDKVLKLESQGPITHRASTLEVAALPATPRSPSSPEHSEVEQVSALGGNEAGRGDEKEKEDCYSSPRVQVSRWLEFLSLQFRPGHAL